MDEKAKFKDNTLSYNYDIDQSLNAEQYEDSEDGHMQFARYLKERILTIDLWNGDSLMHFGTCKVPLSSFLRQGADSKSLAHEYDICEPEYGQTLGSLQLFVSNQGRKIPVIPKREGERGLSSNGFSPDKSNGF
jgi:hypothetical protein